MVRTSSIQDALDLVVLSLRPLAVHGTGICVHCPVDGQEGEHDNGLLVDDVELIANGSHGQRGTGRENSGLGGEVVAGE